MKTTLYKYRQLEPWHYLLDILLHKRLHAAKFYQLNDPMEGIFTYDPTLVNHNFIDDLIRGKDRLNICSLSSVHNSTLMWSYYAASHKGVVIALEVDPVTAPGVVAIDPVRYCSANRFKPFAGSIADVEARRILTRKLTPWRHENEVRIFTHATFVPISIRGIYLGCQMDGETERLFRALAEKVIPNVEVTKMERADLDRPIVRNDT